MKVSFVASVVALANVPWAGLGAAAATPPAYLKCEAYVGEGQIMEGLCRVTTMSNNRVMVEEFSDASNSKARYVFLFSPQKEIESVKWNGERNNKYPNIYLGNAKFSDLCWSSIQSSQIPFSICLFLPKKQE